MKRTRQSTRSKRAKFANAAPVERGGEGHYPPPTPANPKMRTKGEASISAQRVQTSVRMRFNPMRGLTPDRLGQYLDQFDLGFFRQAAIAWDKIERRDPTLKSVAPKRKKAVARHGYDILTVDKLEDSQKQLAEEQQAALKYFFDNLSVTDAIRPDQQGGLNLLARQMMDCQSKYFAVHEVVWQPRPEGLTAQFVFCPLWWFEATTGKLRYLDSEFQVYGRDMLASEWLVTVGEGYMEACSVAWMFKHLSLQDWVAYCEKFGTPFIDAATTASPGGDDWEALVSYVQNFGPDGGGVRSDNAKIELIESKQAAVDAFSQMVENMNRAMTILWRGGDLGTTSSKDGTGASLQGAESDILEGDDAVLIEETLALQISRFVISWSFGPDVPVLAFLKFKTEQDPEAVSFQREVFKAFMQNATIGAALANQVDLKKLTQDVNLPINEEYEVPYVPVSATAGALVSGELVKTGDGIIGARTEAAEETEPAADDTRPRAELLNEAMTTLAETGAEAYAKAVADDLAVLREELAALAGIQDDRILAQRTAALHGKIDALKADILTMPKAAQVLAEIQIAALFSGLTQGPKAQMANGDLPGHEFHGNQYTEASGAASSASDNAHKSKSADDHDTAAAAHEKAGKVAGNEHTRKLHQAMAESHRRSAANQRDFDSQMAAHSQRMADLDSRIEKLDTAKPNAELKAEVEKVKEQVRTTKRQTKAALNQIKREET